MRLRSRRLLETLPLACHDAVSGAPRATWENTRVERRSTRVRYAAARLPTMIFLAALDMHLRKRSVGKRCCCLLLSACCLLLFACCLLLVACCLLLSSCCLLPAACYLLLAACFLLLAACCLLLACLGLRCFQVSCLWRCEDSREHVARMMRTAASML